MTAKTMRGLVAPALAGLLLSLAACSKAEAPKAVAVEKDDTLGGYTGVLNYTDIPIGVVYVNGQWAGGMVANAGGTKWIGSVSVPKQWDPNFKMKISWSDDELYGKDKKALYTKELPVEKYPPKSAAYFYVAFYPNHEVRLYLTQGGPGFKGDSYNLEYPDVVCRRNPPKNPLCHAPKDRDSIVEQSKK